MQRKTHLYYNGRRRREQNGHMTIFCKANLVGGLSYWSEILASRLEEMGMGT